MQTYEEATAPEQIKSCIGRFRLILDKLGLDEVWIAGGAIRKYFDKHNGGDTDLFFKNQQDYDTAFKALMANKAWCPVSIYDNINVTRVATKYGIIDFVKRFFPDANECIRQFDFTVACAAVIKNKDKYSFLCHDTFFIDLSSRSLVINALPFPLSTLQRIQKYNKKGYTICNGGLLEIAKGIQKLNLEQPDQNVLAFYPDGKPRFIGMD